MIENRFGSVATIFGDFPREAENKTRATLTASLKEADELSVDQALPPRFPCGEKNCRSVFCAGAEPCKLAIEVTLHSPDMARSRSYWKTLEAGFSHNLRIILFFALKTWLDVLQIAIGMDNIRLVFLLDYMADYALLLDRAEESLIFHNRSLALKHNCWGRKHHARAKNLEAIAQSNMVSGDFVSAEADLLEAICLRELQLCNGYANVHFDPKERKQQQLELAKAIASSGKLARMYAEIGMFAESERRFETAIDLMQIAALPYEPQLFQAAEQLLSDYKSVLIRSNCSKETRAQLAKRRAA